jgi:hypothetical protein
MAELATNASAKQIYVEKWINYATGREKNDYDHCTVDAITEKMNAGGYTLSNILADITLADSFRFRTAAQ